MKYSPLLVSFPLALHVFARPPQQVLQDLVLDASQFPVEYAVDEQRLLEFEDGSRYWTTELDKFKLKAKGTRFFDVTETQDLGSIHSFTSAPTVTLKYNDTISKVVKTLSTEGPRENLGNFTTFFNRYYRSETGKHSQAWLFNRIKEITDEHASAELHELISIKEFNHTWSQNTIIVSIPGASATNETVIVGAHQDSLNLWSPLGEAHGADDDGSGTVTILEAYRSLIANGVKFKRNVEFHWYSAEEAGLLGSQAVAQQYSQDRVPVVAMLQMDMTAWVKRNTTEEIGVFVDNVDSKLTQTLKELIEAYMSISSVDIECGYACSDHASWTKGGFPSCAAFEADIENINPNIHSENDNLDGSDEFSFEHMLEFSKLAVAFAIELGELAG